MNDIETLAWNSAWEVFGYTKIKKIGLLQEMLVGFYGQEERAYHTRQHLRECFDVLRGTFGIEAAATEREAELIFAIWFHDAIYDPMVSLNEEESARLAMSWLDPEVKFESQVRVASLVMMTRTHFVPDMTREAKMLSDLDLWILGAEKDRFWEYEDQIRREYKAITDRDFYAGRMAVIERFQNRDQIYYFLPREHELRAYDNLRQSADQARNRLRALGG